jgi:hypothetical protein
MYKLAYFRRISPCVPYIGRSRILISCELVDCAVLLESWASTLAFVNLPESNTGMELPRIFILIHDRDRQLQYFEDADEVRRILEP